MSTLENVDADYPAHFIRASQRLSSLLTRSGLLVALGLTVAVFSVLRPDNFPTLSNAGSVLTLAAPLAIVSAGLTVSLVMGDFDLSIGSMIGLGGAFCVVLQSHWHLTWATAVAATLLLAVIAGLINGVLTAYARLSSFIVTLGMGTVLTGVEFGLTGQKTIYQGVDPGYAKLGQSMILGLNVQVWVAVALAVCMWALLRHTEPGRYFYAIGSNPVATRLSGVRVEMLRVVGFVIVSVSAALAGVLLTAQAASSFSNAGQPYLLPAFAAGFLGTTVFGAGRFNIAGTMVAVLLLGVTETGLTMLQLSTAVVLLVQGSVLITAILLSRIGARR